MQTLNQPLVFKPLPAEPAPITLVGPIGWLRTNLFNGWINSILTVVCLLFLGLIIPPLLSWTVFDAAWSGDSEVCKASSGACWTFIGHKIQVFLVGPYPTSELWRPIVAGVVLVIVTLLTALRFFSTLMLIILWLLFPCLAFWLINGGWFLPLVDQSRWGGLMLSIGLALVGILASVPLGIILALGRRSNIVAVKSLCIGIIEPIRGVPLPTDIPRASMTPDRTPPIRPGPAVTAILSMSFRVTEASARAASTVASSFSVWARAAISGTTPPKAACNVA